MSSQEYRENMPLFFVLFDLTTKKLRYDEPVITNCTQNYKLEKTFPLKSVICSIMAKLKRKYNHNNSLFKVIILISKYLQVSLNHYSFCKYNDFMY